MTPHERDIPLRDGRTLTLRSIKPTDSAAYHVFLARVMNESPWTGRQAHEIPSPDEYQSQIESWVSNPGI